MGVYTQGYASFSFSRELSADEFKAWMVLAPQAEFYSDWRTDTKKTVEEEFCINGSQWGDIGEVTADTKGVEFSCSGKVYDIRAGLEAMFRSLPADVIVQGGGEFDSDGEEWAIEAIEGPEHLVRDCDTEAQADAKALEEIAAVLRSGDEGVDGWTVESRIADIVAARGHNVGGTPPSPTEGGE